MKKNYVKPLFSSETFLPSEYIAACGYSGGGTVYGWMFNQSELIGDASGLATGSDDEKRTGVIIPSPIDVNVMTDLFTTNSNGEYNGINSAYSSSYGWTDDGDGIIESGEYLSYNYNGKTVKVLLKSSDDGINGIAAPQSREVEVISGTKNFS